MSSRRRDYIQRDSRVGRKSAISNAGEDGKSCIGAVGASNIRVTVIVKISRPGRAGFLPDSYRLTLREIAGAISEINRQIRAEIMSLNAIGGQWISKIHVAILVEISERN